MGYKKCDNFDCFDMGCPEVVTTELTSLENYLELAETCLETLNDIIPCCLNEDGEGKCKKHYGSGAHGGCDCDCGCKKTECYPCQCRKCDELLCGAEKKYAEAKAKIEAAITAITEIMVEFNVETEDSGAEELCDAIKLCKKYQLCVLKNGCDKCCEPKCEPKCGCKGGCNCGCGCQGGCNCGCGCKGGCC